MEQEIADLGERAEQYRKQSETIRRQEEAESRASQQQSGFGSSARSGSTSMTAAAAAAADNNDGENNGDPSDKFHSSLDEVAKLLEDNPPVPKPVSKPASKGKKLPVSKTRGRCSIRGCSWTTLAADHRCRHCGDAGIHNLCAKEKGLTGATNELDMYCSDVCRKGAEGEESPQQQATTKSAIAHPQARCPGQIRRRNIAGSVLQRLINCACRLLAAISCTLLVL